MTRGGHRSRARGEEEPDGRRHLPILMKDEKKAQHWEVGRGLWKDRE